MRFLYLPAILLLLCSCRNTQRETVQNVDNGTEISRHAIKAEEAYYKETTSKDRIKIIEKQSVNFYNTRNDRHPRILLVEKVRIIDTLDGREEGSFALTVEAFTSDRASYDKKLWQIKDNQSTASGVWFNFYQSVRYGCCGAEDAYSLYDLDDGQLQFTCTVKERMVSNGSYPAEGLVAYQSKRSMSWSGEISDGTVGFLYYYLMEYNPKRKQLKKYAIKANQENSDLIWSPTLKVLSLSNAIKAYPADHAQLRQLTGKHLLLLEYSEETKLFIPVENNLPLIGRAFGKGADFIIGEHE